MKTFAYCIASGLAAVQQAVSGFVMTAPPYKAETFNPALLEGCGFLYFRLEGMAQIPRAMFGDEVAGVRSPALYAEQLLGLNLSGAVVLLANCYSTTSLFPAAFYRVGARAVIAGEGSNYAARNAVIGADLLAKWLLFYLRAGLPPDRALRRAKMRLIPTLFRAADRDALAFKLMEGNYA